MDRFRRDPDLFFANRPGILFLDEIQHVPDISPFLRREIDRSKARGVGFRFLLSGSQRSPLMNPRVEQLTPRVYDLPLGLLLAGPGAS